MRLSIDHVWVDHPASCRPGPRARVLVAGVKQPRLSAFCVTGGNVDALDEGAAEARPARPWFGRARAGGVASRPSPDDGRGVRRAVADGAEAATVEP